MRMTMGRHAKTVKGIGCRGFHNAHDRNIDAEHMRFILINASSEDCGFARGIHPGFVGRSQ